MIKINSKRDLPDWFRLELYDAAAGFGAHEWMLELTLRNNALLQLRVFRERRRLHLDDDPFARDESEAKLADFITQLRHTPVGVKFPGNCFYDMALVEVSNDGLDFSRPVKPLTFETLLWQRESDRLAIVNGYPPAWDEVEDSLASINRCWDVISGDISNGAAEDLNFPVKMSNHSLSRWPHPALLINLNSPDSILIEGFRQWLKQTRNTDVAGRSVRRKPLYERWSRYGLLPYLDLNLWALETEVEIPDRVMSAAIAQHGHDRGEDNLRKTVAPIVENLHSHIMELEHLLAFEIEASE